MPIDAARTGCQWRGAIRHGELGLRAVAADATDLSQELCSRELGDPAPGGRVSIFEPINNYFPDSTDEFWGFDSRPVRDLVAKVGEYEGWVTANPAAR